MTTANQRPIRVGLQLQPQHADYATIRRTAALHSRCGQPGRRLVKQCLGKGTVPRGQMRLSGGEEPDRTIVPVQGQLRRPGQERGLRDVAASLFRPRGGTFEVRRDLLLRNDGRRRAVPHRLVRVPVLPGDARPGLMDPAPVA